MNLVGITLLYFSFPLLVFLATFVNPIVSAVLTAALAISVYIVSSAPRSQEHNSRKEILIILVSSFIFTYLSGAGNLAFQNSDWLKHNAILHTLMSEPWPVVFASFQGGAHDIFLNYYLGWYMVPALVGKALGDMIWAALAAQYVYTFLGVALVFTWLKNLLGKISIFHIIFFVFFATADTAGILALGKTGLINLVTPIEGWSLPGLLEYSSFTTLLFWVPGQAIAGWITTAVIIKAISDKKYLLFSSILLPLAAFWSPFAVLGVLPFYLLMIFSNIRTMPQSINRQGLLVIVTSLLLLAFLGVYYLSNLGSAESGGISLTLSHLRSAKELVRFVLFYIFEALVPAAILAFYCFDIRSSSQQVDSKVCGHYLIAAFILLTLPFFKLGINNDLLMRASIPSLFVLYFSTVRYFAKFDFLTAVRISFSKPYKLMPLFIVLYLLFGAITPITELSRTMRGKRADFARLGIDSIGTRQMQLQYMGKELWMMKK